MFVFLGNHATTTSTTITTTTTTRKPYYSNSHHCINLNILCIFMYTFFSSPENPRATTGRVIVVTTATGHYVVSTDDQDINRPLDSFLRYRRSRPRLLRRPRPHGGGRPMPGAPACVLQSRAGRRTRGCRRWRSWCHIRTCRSSSDPSPSCGPC